MLNLMPIKYLNELRLSSALVTGATGFVGRYLCAALVGIGVQTYGLSRSASKLTMPIGVIPVPVEIEKRAEVLAAFQHIKPNLVLHLAAAGVTDPFLPVERALEVNVTGVLNVLEAARSTSVRRFVHVGTSYEHPASSTEANAGPSNPYVASKLAAWLFWHAYVKDYGLESIAVRLFNVYGPGQPIQGLIAAAIVTGLRAKPFRITPGEQLRDFVFIDDVVESLVFAAGASNAVGKTYDIGTGIARSVRSASEYIFETIGVSSSIDVGSVAYRPNEVMALIANTDPAANDLGWSAQTSFESGIDQTISWYQRQIALEL